MSAEAFREALVVPHDRIIVAYDGMEWEDEAIYDEHGDITGLAEGIMTTAEEVGPHTGMGKTNSAHVKLGASHAIDTLAELGQFTMLDSKFHDIPRTVGLSVKAAAAASASLVTVHASGGLEMLQYAVKGAEAGRAEIKDVFRRQSLDRIGGVLGITVLTSLEDEAISIFGIDPNDEEGIQKKVLEFAGYALEAGLTGIVCAPLEARAVRANSNFDGLLVVTPGITPAYAKKEGDQKRTTTAREAINEGADLIVVGSAINKAEDYDMTKAEAAQEVAAEIAEGLSGRSE
jgi:orotidine-5'-phosphate decarboxylase